MSRAILPTLAAILSVAAGAVAQTTQPFVPFTLTDRQPPAASHFRIDAVASHTQVTPGGSFHVALDIRIDDGWVYYSPAPGATADYSPKPANITFTAGELKAGQILWPPDHRHRTDLGGELFVINNVYENRAVVYVPVSVPPELPDGKYELVLAAGGQICDSVCLDVGAKALVAVSVGPSAVANPAWSGDIASGLAVAVTAEELKAAHASRPGESVAFAGDGVARTGQLTPLVGLGLALLAGLILNVMPCVLPVVPLRILSLVALAKESRRRFVTVGLAFAGGIVLFFAVLAGVNVLMQVAMAGALGLSDHFQYPQVRIALALIVVALAANLFGAFTVVVPTRVAQIDPQGGRSRGGYLSSAGMGFMMAVLATPCSFAILAAALAWAQLQSLLLGTVAIILIGVGMAAPHAVLIALPNLLSKLPRPGRWMELLKQSMAFVLLLVALWLVSTLGEQAYAFWVMGYGIVLVFCLWMWGSWVRYDAPLRQKLIVRGLSVALVTAAGLWMLRAPVAPAVSFEQFDSARIASARSEGRTVLVDFTASWCLSCQWIERVIYDNGEVAAELASRGVVTFKGDVTNAGSPAREMLYGQLKEPGPPVTVIFPPGAGRPIRLVGKFSKADLFKAIDAARQ